MDVWKSPKWTPEDGKQKLLEVSSFSTLFPQYREKYLKDNWGEVKRILKPHKIEATLDSKKGAMTVSTTDGTWDPYIIVKARDMIKLMARSVPVKSAARVLEDDVFCDLIKIGGMLHNKERFVKRRQRLLGPNGSTLKAIELLTECYVLVQGQTVAAIGPVKGLKKVRRLVEDCMHNIHPVYHVKELMIRRELEKDPDLAKEDWSRFLPQFKRRSVKPKKSTKRVAKKVTKNKSPFPQPQTPRKEDLAMESGEYFANEAVRSARVAKRGSVPFASAKSAEGKRAASSSQGKKPSSAGGGAPAAKRRRILSGGKQ